MRLFNKVFRINNTISIVAPVSGECKSVHEVSDPTFATDMLGKGVAIIPSEGRVYAPGNGAVTFVFPTGHAVGMMLDSGVEILIHIGIDTVELNGIYFTKHVDAGQTVKKGDLLVEVDLDGIKSNGYDIVTPVIVCNSDEFKSVEIQTGTVKALETEILTVINKR